MTPEQVEAELIRQHERVTVLAHEAHLTARPELSSILASIDRSAPFFDYSHALMDFHFELAWRHIQEIGVHLAEKNDMSRRDMKLKMKHVHKIMTDRIQNMINVELDTYADEVDTLHARNMQPKDKH